MSKLALTVLSCMVLAGTTGCPASVYAGEQWPSAATNTAEITTDPIKAPSDMANACGQAGYTVDESSTPFLVSLTDRDAHDVVFHCNDGSKPVVP